MLSRKTGTIIWIRTVVNFVSKVRIAVKKRNREVSADINCLLSVLIIFSSYYPH